MKIPIITKSVFKLPFSVWLLILQTFMLVNTEAFFPGDVAENARFVILTYMVFTLAGLTVFGKIPGWFTLPAEIALRHFVLGLLVTSATLMVFFSPAALQFIFPYATYDPVRTNLALVFFQAFVVATSEELVFRGVLPTFLGWLPAQFLFGLFHFVAYGGDWSAILFATAAGILFYAIASSVSIYTAMGGHTAGNIYARLG